MNLYFRLIRLLFINLFQKNYVDPFSPTELTFRVWPFDMDINMHMNNARYLSMMDLGRIHHMTRSGLMRTIMKHKWMPIVGKLDIRYIRALDAFQKYTLRSEITGHDEKYFYLKQTFIKDGKEVAVANVTGLFLNRKGKKIPSEDVINALNEKIK